ncbi:hypothetical protein ACHQM5_021641 [Ranunculus cassubicifolius]
MADALISMVAEEFFCFAKEEFGLVVGVREQVGKLRLTLEIIQGVLQDAEQKQVKNNSVKVWLGELRDVLYEADDVMDKWNTEMALSQRHSGVGQVDVVVNPRGARKVLSYLLCSCFKNVTVRYDIGHRIKEIGDRLDDINAKRNQFGLVDSPSQDQPRLITSSIIDVSKIHGRDQDSELIVSRLLGETSHQDTGVQVVAIVGMGGFGKTTLAKLVLKEEGVVKNFEKKMWVCVSEPFNLFNVAKAIIEQAEGEVPRSTEWELMHQSLSKSVKGKRFLLILDDVWTNNPNHWHPLKASLDGGASGCRIIVTTRNEKVAKMMGSYHIHNLQKLSEGDSWSLVRDIALKGRDYECQKFEKVGREIANKCKGVPLALSTLASLLCVKMTVQNWRDIFASDLWGLAHIEDFFLPSLFLSYYSLPSISKQCFLYCAVFPKDTKLEKDVLVKLWMAEGFLGSGRMRDLEIVGEEHFDNLAARSFFQDFEQDSNGNITWCKMHDLVHDFARFLSQGECSNGPELDCDKVRYLYGKEIENSSLHEAKKVRTLMSVKRDFSLYELFSKLSCLRVLDLQWNEIVEFPEAVEKLVHLRFLDLSGNIDLLKLPETICNLYNLQTLILNYCDKLKKLPEEIGRLSNLRHLEIEDTDELRCLPESIKRLRSLRTLSKFIVSEGCKIGDLKHLKNLRGALELEGLGGMTDESDAIEAELKKKKDLRSLSFNWERSYVVEEESDDAAIMRTWKNIFERLEPYQDLEELNVSYYPGSLLPRWFGDSSVLGNIVNMKLHRCGQITELPALGKLASLESLKISGMGSVESIGREFYYGFDSSSLGAEMIAFPKSQFMGISNHDESIPQVLFSKLTKLRMSYMDKLEEWSVPLEKYEANTMMPSLTDLNIEDCPRLRVLPDLTKFKSLVSLELNGLGSWETEEKGKERGEQIERLDSMPSCFTKLSIYWCPKLLEVPTYLFSPWLKELTIGYCPELSGLQCLPPLLERLELRKDNGGYSKSIPLENKAECSINHFTLGYHPHSSLPDGFENLKSLQQLGFRNCEFLDFELKELQHFTMLQELRIWNCPVLEEHFQGDDWRIILPHVHKITINYDEITNNS